LQKSVLFLLPYARGEKTHAEYVYSRVPFDRQRAAAGQKAYQTGRLFEPREAIPTLTAYYFFDQGILPLLQQLSGKAGLVYPSWDVFMENIELQ